MPSNAALTRAWLSVWRLEGGHNTRNVGAKALISSPSSRTTASTRSFSGIVFVKTDNAQTDAVYDAQQAIRLVRAHAKDFEMDPNKIGIMGFSAGAELTATAAVLYDDFGKANSADSDPLNHTSGSRQPSPLQLSLP